ncbi:MAG: DEAD/DEAH box helicase family protein [Oculatellaceae cyanobacterium Prado106]|jgi:superfamily II DNA or RNA helicase|nr:DEAD/DEAH box helicase family protein [Oculatellaceae cyanobacterium Prado106]
MTTPHSASEQIRIERSAESSSSEDLFVDIFQETLGFERTQLLIPQYPVRDIYDGGRFIDFAFISRLSKYAFEIDGEAWHAPEGEMVSAQTYRDQLLRQNSLVYQGWKVYRWTDIQLANERERIQEQLLLFLEREIAQGTLDSFLPKQEAGEISLKEHQTDALKELDALRQQGKTIALLTHATGTGKTHIAISDAQRLGLRTLYLAHRKPLISQTQARFSELWPDASSAIYQKKSGKPETHIVLSTIQAISDALEQFDEREFGYIIIDESHHAAADTYRKVISYFRAKFILGLTATPERHDGQSLTEIFQNCAHRLELEEAIQRGLLVPIRCIRVKTNVDLSKVRFNGIDYRSSDLGKALQVPDRDRLIVETYTEHAIGKRAVCFCLDVTHAETMAELFNQQGVKSSHVSGRMSDKQKDQILDDYRSGVIQVLCACDILNEGWDSPETEVLLMARPTLSKVVYVQQLGRGTRTAPGKESLLVFDFIDNTSRYTQALNTHRLFRNPHYRPGALVAAPSNLVAEEEAAYARGEKPTAILGLHLWVDKYEAIDIFRWQDEVKEMYQTRELEVELGVGDNVVKHWVTSGKLLPDHTILIGNQTYYYFKKERLSDIRQQFNLTPVTAENIKDKFMEFTREMDMRYSYKPVLLLGLLQLADDKGKVKIPDLVAFFKNFYRQRLENHQVVEKSGSRMEQVKDLSDAAIEAILLAHPFEKFERRKFVHRLKELTLLKFDPVLWKRLTSDDKAELKQFAETALQDYYQRLEPNPGEP